MIYTTNHLPSRTITIDNQEYLWFSGTSYLGMAHHQGFRENFIRAIARYGTSWGSSRNNSVRLEIFEKAELALAKFAQMPAALTVSSGMWAGQLVTHFLQQQNATFYYAPKTHPALWQSNSLDLRDWEKGLNYTKWSKIIAQKIRESDEENIVICSDAIGSPYVEAFDFQWIEDLPKDKNITVVVDASHSLGVINGIQSRSTKVIITASLNKALAMPGGVIFSDAATIAQIRQTPMFAGSSPMMPALLDAFVNSTEFYQEQQQKLLENIQYFNGLISQNTFLDSVENYPAYCTYQEGFFGYLKENGVMTACFPYPSANDKPVTRLVISALHTKEDLEKVGRTILRKSSFQRTTSV
ncbi:MAG: aminotransferase class I/II-fold pyridoxal phosphate-dependent enzyme [Arcicella sp.]|nr:aminotransferase class I/II-fold pyridoxal phosphate-dependent enzyme [Arcicella sp.]